jgi:hypothetical protein
MATKARIKAKPQFKVKKAPIKAGSTRPRNIGGVVNYKMVLITKKRKDG